MVLLRCRAFEALAKPLEKAWVVVADQYTLRLDYRVDAVHT